jgi:hypothetical protein
MIKQFRNAGKCGRKHLLHFPKGTVCLDHNALFCCFGFCHGLVIGFYGLFRDIAKIMCKDEIRMKEKFKAILSLKMIEKHFLKEVKT